MASSTRGVNDDTTPVDLSQNVTGDGSDAGTWHRNVSSNQWAWFYIIAGVASLWALGRVFR
jgi:hypothetical protein